MKNYSWISKILNLYIYLVPIVYLNPKFYFVYFFIPKLMYEREKYQKKKEKRKCSIVDIIAMKRVDFDGLELSTCWKKKRFKLRNVF